MPIPLWVRVGTLVALSLLGDRRKKRPTGTAALPRKLQFRSSPGPRCSYYGESLATNLIPLLWRVVPYTVDLPGQLVHGLKGHRLFAAVYIQEGPARRVDAVWMDGGPGQPWRRCPLTTVETEADGSVHYVLQNAPGVVHLRTCLAANGLQGVSLQEATADWRTQRWTADHKGVGCAWAWLTMDQPPYGPGIGSKFWGDAWPRFALEIQGRLIPIPSAGTRWSRGYTDSAAAVRFYLQHFVLGKPAAEFDLNSVRLAHKRSAERVVVNLPRVVRWVWRLRPTADGAPPRPQAQDRAYPPMGWSAAKLEPGPGETAWVTPQTFDESRDVWTSYGAPIRLQDGPAGRVQAVAEAVFAAPAASTGNGDDPGPDIDLPEIVITVDPDDPDLPDTDVSPLPDPADPTGTPRRRRLADAVGSRYAVGGCVLSTDRVEDVLEELDFAWAGREVERNGVIHYLPGEDRPLLASGLRIDPTVARLIEFQGSPDRSERANRFRMQLTQDRTIGWEKGAIQLVDAPQLAADGVVLPLDLGECPWITSPIAGLRRLAIHGRQAREPELLAVSVNPGESADWLAVLEGDVLPVLWPAIGIDREARFEVLEVDVLEDWTVEIRARKSSLGTHDDTITLGGLQPDISIPGVRAPDVEGLALEENARVNPDGTYVARFIGSWTPAAVARTQVRWRIFVAAGETHEEQVDGSRVVRRGPFHGAWTDLTSEGDQVAIDGVAIGIRIEVQARHVTTRDVEGVWSPIVWALSLGDTVGPALPVGGRSIAGDGNTNILWTMPTEPDYALTNIRSIRGVSSQLVPSVLAAVHTPQRGTETTIQLGGSSRAGMGVVWLKHQDWSGNDRGWTRLDGVEQRAPDPATAEWIDILWGLGTSDRVPPESPEFAAAGRVPPIMTAARPYLWGWPRRAPRTGGGIQLEFGPYEAPTPWACHESVNPSGRFVRQVELRRTSVGRDGLEGFVAGQLAVNRSYPMLMIQVRYRASSLAPWGPWTPPVLFRVVGEDGNVYEGLFARYEGLRVPAIAANEALFATNTATGYDFLQGADVGGAVGPPIVEAPGLDYVVYDLSPPPPDGLSFNAGWRFVGAPSTAQEARDHQWRVSGILEGRPVRDYTFFTIGVRAAAPPAAPQLPAVLPSLAWTVGDTVNTVLPAAIRGNGNLVYSFDTGDTFRGVDFNGRTRRLSGTVSAGSEGNFGVIYRVTNPDTGLSDSGLVFVAISNPPPPPMPGWQDWTDQGRIVSGNSPAWLLRTIGSFTSGLARGQAGEFHGDEPGAPDGWDAGEEGAGFRAYRTAGSLSDRLTYIRVYAGLERWWQLQEGANPLMADGWVEGVPTPASHWWRRGFTIGSTQTLAEHLRADGQPCQYYNVPDRPLNGGEAGIAKRISATVQEAITEDQTNSNYGRWWRRVFVVAEDAAPEPEAEREAAFTVRRWLLTADRTAPTSTPGDVWPLPDAFDPWRSAPPSRTASRPIRWRVEAREAAGVLTSRWSDPVED